MPSGMQACNPSHLNIISAGEQRPWRAQVHPPRCDFKPAGAGSRDGTNELSVLDTVSSNPNRFISSVVYSLKLGHGEQVKRSSVSACTRINNLYLYKYHPDAREERNLFPRN